MIVRDHSGMYPIAHGGPDGIYVRVGVDEHAGHVDPVDRDGDMLDVLLGHGGIEIAPGDESVILTLEPAAPNVARGAIGIRFTTDDIDGAHSVLKDRDVETDEILRWPGIPAMFAFRDPDGNAYSITATA